MANIGLWVVRVFLSISLISTIFLFALSLSLSEQTDGKTLDALIIELSSTIIEEEISKQTSHYDETQTSELYQGLLVQCTIPGVDSVLLGTTDIELACDEIETVGEDGIIPLIQEQIETDIQAELQNELQERNISQFIIVLDILVISTGVLSLILLLILFLVDKPLYLFAINIGIVALIAGFPFIIIELLITTQSTTTDSALQTFIWDVLHNTGIKLLITFITGAILLILGFFQHYTKLNKPQRKEKRKKA